MVEDKKSMKMDVETECALEQEDIKSGKRSGDYILEIRGISKSFPGVHALSNVSLQLKRGEVLALVGENGAGKSTMMKILAGVYTLDAGDILIDGESVIIGSVERATNLGIALVHQELNLCDNLTVAGNVFLGREPKKGLFNKFVDTERLNNDTAEVLKKVGLSVSPSAILRELPIGTQQLVEISKALSINAKIVMFDEPTSSLSEHETEQLFKVIRDLSKQGVSCIYISHRLGEVKEVADRVVVLRDGKLSGCLEKHEINRDAMIRLMVGRDIEKMYQKNHTVSDKVRVELKDFIVPKRASYPIDLTIKGGEIVVLSGLVGAGRTELLHAIFGIDKRWGGKIFIDGSEMHINTPAEAIKAGMVLVPEDRKLNGLVVNMEIDNNIALPGLKDHLSKNGFINRDKVDELADRMVKLLDIRLYMTSQLAESLSGGNQQKVVLAKWLSMDPVFLLLDEPTRGIDVGAKAEIYKLLEDLAQTGVAILVASSEMQEVLGIADKIVVMCEGRVTGELDPLTCEEEDVIKLATESAVC
ncbi:MAG: sugar ABC transporter ATP-binding protein [Sphaerochaetaceae bacterium]|nr:sugar ABC transporter ATP-binding protein [Sphaerochaetaceae bacterium]MDD2406545.1 sugar ABC transporter ATP-binding protein [Sphaerochaetaceae bacterium]MDD3670092.1 sugar ABC transporter ATP-binding protein [Sphaerochaetaceae bacterium]MDD4260403.1 sugar ABC transporter ATP-binding protein [Sphaerochaetaceae bacterium]MDD4763417.1 sugar ABC transporter ATP-binding protein [Sphaerochaetaceae bacterium]